MCVQNFMAIQLIGWESAILILYYKKNRIQIAAFSCFYYFFTIEIGTFAKLAQNNYGNFCLVEHIRGDTVLEWKFAWEDHFSYRVSWIILVELWFALPCLTIRFLNWIALCGKNENILSILTIYFISIKEIG